MAYQLSERTIGSIEETLGLSIDEIDNLDFEQEMALIAEKRGSRPQFRFTSDVRFMPRGSVLLSDGRWTDSSELNRKSDEICKLYYESE